MSEKLHQHIRITSLMNAGWHNVTGAICWLLMANTSDDMTTAIVFSITAAAMGVVSISLFLRGYLAACELAAEPVKGICNKCGFKAYTRTGRRGGQCQYCLRGTIQPEAWDEA